jgi:hypothetical protein
MKKITFIFSILAVSVFLSGCIWSPPSPQGLLPVSGTENIGSAVALSWNAIEPGAGWIKLRYDLYLSESTDPELYTGNLVNNAYSVTALKPNTRYYWRVVARNITQGTASPSKILYFSTR